MPWFVARTRGRESRACVDLERHGVRAFCPKLHRYSIDKRTKQEKFRPSALMPGYAFVRLETAQDRDKVGRCMFVASLLGCWTGERFTPREIPSSYVAELIDHGPFEIGKRHSHSNLKRGQKVKLALNGIAEIIAEVEGIDQSGKVMVWAELFGGSRLVHVEHERLEVLAL